MIRFRKSLTQLGFAVSLFLTGCIWIWYFKSSKFTNDPVSFGRIIYLATWGISILWLSKFALCIKKGEFNFIHPREVVYALLTSLSISGLVFTLCQPEYRVLVDEATLTSISYMMKKHATATTLYMSRVVDGELLPILQRIDKRPPLFPFLSHLVHWGSGYSYKNPFTVNFAIFTAFLSLIYLSFVLRFGRGIAFILQLSVALQPAVFLTATSAGLDLLSCTLLGLVLALIGLAKKRKSLGLFTLVLLTLALYSFTRYESGFIAILIGSAFWTTIRGARLLEEDLNELTWFAPIPLLLTPLVWLLLLLLNPSFHEVEEAQSVFSFSHLLPNVAALFQGFFSPPKNYPHLQAFYVVCLVSLGALSILAWRKRHLQESTAVFISILACVVSTSIVLLHFFGSYLHANALRLFLYPVTAFTLCPGILLGLQLKQLRNSKNAHHLKSAINFLSALLMGAIFFYSLRHRTAETIFTDIGATQRFKLASEYLTKNPKNDPKTTLIVSQFPTEFSIFGFSSIDFSTLEANTFKIKQDLKKGIFTHAYIFQNIEKPTGEPRLEERVNLLLQPIAQKPISPRHDLRVSELEVH